MYRSLWQIIKKRPRLLVPVLIIYIVFIVLFVFLFTLGSQSDWTGFNGYNKVTIARTISGPSAGTVTRTEEYVPGKTLWDWLGLIAILSSVVVTGLGTAWTVAKQARDSEVNRQSQHEDDLEVAAINRESQRQTEFEITIDNQRETALQGYIDKIFELLLKEHLGELTSAGKLPPKYEEVQKIARLRTLTVLPSLDGRRKKRVLQLLYESELIEKGKSIIPLSEADLSEADLSGANLRKADLSGANLRKTDLSGADLNEADLSKANLSNAILFNADLSNTILEGTKFNKAWVTKDQLDKAKSLKGATMPDGSKHP